MKKILILVLLSTMVSLGKSNGVPKNLTPKANIQKLKFLICTGEWHYTYYTDGSKSSATNTSCWNLRQGHHTTTITYPKNEE